MCIVIENFPGSSDSASDDLTNDISDEISLSEGCHTHSDTGGEVVSKRCLIKLRFFLSN